MEQRARRWVIWSGVAMSLVASLLVGTFVAYWHAAWPFPAHLVAATSPWLQPRLRAHAKDMLSAEPGFSPPPGLSYFIDQHIRVRGSSVYPEYLACLRSEDVSVRWASLMFIESVKAVGPLPEDVQMAVIQAIEDPDPEVSDMAMRAIGSLPPNVAKPVLRRALSSVDHRFHAIRILAVPGDHEAAAWLVPMLEDADPTIRGLVVRSLTTIADPATIPAVKRLSDDTDKFVARGVQEFFEKMSVSPAKEYP